MKMAEEDKNSSPLDEGTEIIAHTAQTAYATTAAVAAGGTAAGARPPVQAAGQHLHGRDRGLLSGDADRGQAVCRRKLAGRLFPRDGYRDRGGVPLLAAQCVPPPERGRAARKERVKA